MSWGWKIVVVYVLFVAMTLSMVVYFMRQKVDLVATDYYKQEIEYQDQLDKISNARSLQKQVGFEYDAGARRVKVEFPAQHVNDGLSGDIHFYRPSDADQDRTFDISPNDDGLQEIAIGSLPRGLWRVKISWSSGGVEFYDEKALTL